MLLNACIITTLYYFTSGVFSQEVVLPNEELLSDISAEDQQVVPPIVAKPQGAPQKVFAPHGAPPSNPQAAAAAQAVPQPAAEAVPQPAAQQPAAQAVPQPAAQAVPQPAAQAVPQPAAQAVPQPAAQAVPQPAAQAVPKPAVVATEVHDVVEPTVGRRGVGLEQLGTPMNSTNQGPRNELELPEDDYRELHHEVTLFGDDFIEELGMSGSNVVEKWSELMKDFIPDMFVTLAIPARSDQYFYQEMGPLPTLIRGAYFVGAEEDKSVALSVIDPKGQIMVHSINPEGIYSVVSRMEGTYVIMLSNRNWVTQKYVTILMGAGNDTALRIEDVNDVNQNVLMVARMLRDVQAESQYFWSKQKNQLRNAQKTNVKVAIACLVELAVCLGVVFLQIHFLKRLVENKKIY